MSLELPKENINQDKENPKKLRYKLSSKKVLLLLLVLFFFIGIEIFIINTVLESNNNVSLKSNIDPNKLKSKDKKQDKSSILSLKKCANDLELWNYLPKNVKEDTSHHDSDGNFVSGYFDLIQLDWSDDCINLPFLLVPVGRGYPSKEMYDEVKNHMLGKLGLYLFDGKSKSITLIYANNPNGEFDYSKASLYWEGDLFMFEELFRKDGSAQSVTKYVFNSINQKVTLVNYFKNYSGIGISFFYPSIYEIDVYKTSSRLSLYSPLDPNRADVGEVQGNELKVEIVIYPASKNETLDKIFNETEASIKTMGTILDKKDLSINGIPAKYLKTYRVEEYMLLAKDKKIFIMKYPVATTRQSEFDQILSTFKVE